MDIFIGYKSEDRERVRRLSAALTDLGYSVFWDQNIPAGSTWRQTIGKALEDSRLVIICWSKATLDDNAAKWVLDEADEAVRTKKPMVPVRLDEVAPPMGHRQIQALDLSGWAGDKTAPAFAELQFAVAEALAGRSGSWRAIGGGVRKGRPLLWAGAASAVFVGGVIAGRLIPMDGIFRPSSTLAGAWDVRLLDPRVSAVVEVVRKSAYLSDPGYVMGGKAIEVVEAGPSVAYVCVDFDEGSMFEGALRKAPPNSAVPDAIGPEYGEAPENSAYLDVDSMEPLPYDVTGNGVMWSADGSVQVQGRWENGQLVEAFAAPDNVKFDSSKAAVRREVEDFAWRENSLAGDEIVKRRATSCETRPGARPPLSPFDRISPSDETASVALPSDSLLDQPEVSSEPAPP